VEKTWPSVPFFFFSSTTFDFNWLPLSRGAVPPGGRVALWLCTFRFSPPCLLRRKTVSEDCPQSTVFPVSFFFEDGFGRRLQRVKFGPFSFWDPCLPFGGADWGVGWGGGFAVGRRVSSAERAPPHRAPPPCFFFFFFFFSLFLFWWGVFCIVFLVLFFSFFFSHLERFWGCYCFWFFRGIF